MNQVWLVVVCIIGLLGFWLGLEVHRFRTKRNNRERFNVIFDDFIHSNSNHATADLSLALPRDDRALYDLYVKCHHGLYDRAYTIASQMNRNAPSGKVGALLLRLGLLLNRYEHLDSLLNRPESLDGLERITFANLVCAGRWQEAVSFYKLRIFERHGSQVEWRLLQLCAAAFTQMPVDKTHMSEYEIQLLNHLLSKFTKQEKYFKSVSDYLSIGVCYVDELRFLSNRKFFHYDDESNVDTSHLTKERAVRGDWIGAEHEDFCRALGIDATCIESSKPHLLRVRSWLQGQRGYRCSYCGEVRSGFGLVCNHCLRLEFGQPMRMTARCSAPPALAVHGIDMVRVERIHWMALLHAT